MQREGLKRELGVIDVALSVINISIASGIFLLPAIIAGLLGGASIIAYIICGLMFLLVALCYAEVSARISDSGGAYTYIEHAFGPYVGFLANGIFWFGGGVLACAALVNGIADMLSVPLPIFGYILYRTLLFLLILGAFAYINIRGIRQGMTSVKIFTYLKIIPLLLIVISGIISIDRDNLAWPGMPDSEKIGEACLILFFAFTGGETALNISGEMKNPNRTAPRGLLIGVSIIVAFFCLLQLVAQGILGTATISQSKAPLAEAAGVLFGPWGFSLLVGCAIVSIMGSLNSLVMVFPRAIYAGAKDGLMPGFLARIHPRYATPHRAIVLFAALSFILAVSGGFKQLLILATLSLLLLHVGVVLGLIKFRLDRKHPGQVLFKIPGGLAIPVIALLMLLWFVWQSKANEVTGMLVFVFVLSFMYLLRKLISKKTGGIQQKKLI